MESLDYCTIARLMAVRKEFVGFSSDNLLMQNRLRENRGKKQ
jgi:hypothetical protein